MNFDLNRLLRENIKKLKPYSSARSEFSGVANVFLDANENAFGSPLMKWYNRYPDPLQWEVKKKISTIKNIAAENILLGNGSDECIDLVIRAFCDPKHGSMTARVVNARRDLSLKFVACARLPSKSSLPISRKAFSGLKPGVEYDA